MNRKKMAKVETEGTNIAEASCKDRSCPLHGNLKARGKTFKGIIIKKFPRRVVIEFERMVYVRKYERYTKSKTKIHARVPGCMENSLHVGDLIKVQECRPLSKIVHFVVIENIEKKTKEASK